MNNFNPNKSSNDNNSNQIKNTDNDTNNTTNNSNKSSEQKVIKIEEMIIVEKNENKITKKLKRIFQDFFGEKRRDEVKNIIKNIENESKKRIEEENEIKNKKESKNKINKEDEVKVNGSECKIVSKSCCEENYEENQYDIAMALIMSMLFYTNKIDQKQQVKDGIKKLELKFFEFLMENYLKESNKTQKTNEKDEEMYKKIEINEENKENENENIKNFSAILDFFCDHFINGIIIQSASPDNHDELDNNIFRQRRYIAIVIYGLINENTEDECRNNESIIEAITCLHDAFTIENEPHQSNEINKAIAKIILNINNAMLMQFNEYDEKDVFELNKHICKITIALENKDNLNNLNRLNNSNNLNLSSKSNEAPIKKLNEQLNAPPTEQLNEQLQKTLNNFFDFYQEICKKNGYANADNDDEDISDEDEIDIIEKITAEYHESLKEKLKRWIMKSKNKLNETGENIKLLEYDKGEIDINKTLDDFFISYNSYQKIHKSNGNEMLSGCNNDDTLYLTNKLTEANNLLKNIDNYEKAKLAATIFTDICSNKNGIPNSIYYESTFGLLRTMINIMLTNINDQNQHLQQQITNDNNQCQQSQEQTSSAQTKISEIIKEMLKKISSPVPHLLNKNNKKEIFNEELKILESKLKALQPNIEQARCIIETIAVVLQKPKDSQKLLDNICKALAIDFIPKNLCFDIYYDVLRLLKTIEKDIEAAKKNDDQIFLLIDSFIRLKDEKTALKYFHQLTFKKEKNSNELLNNYEQYIQMYKILAKYFIIKENLSKPISYFLCNAFKLYVSNYTDSKKHHDEELFDLLARYLQECQERCVSFNIKSNTLKNIILTLQTNDKATSEDKKNKYKAAVKFFILVGHIKEHDFPKELNQEKQEGQTIKLNEEKELIAIDEKNKKTEEKYKKIEENEPKDKQVGKFFKKIQQISNTNDAQIEEKYNDEKNKKNYEEIKIEELVERENKKNKRNNDLTLSPDENKNKKRKINDNLTLNTNDTQIKEKNENKEKNEPSTVPATKIAKTSMEVQIPSSNTQFTYFKYINCNNSQQRDHTKSSKEQPGKNTFD